MSKYHVGREAITLSKIIETYKSGRKLSVVTCYDAAFARLIDQTAIDMVLVGDSLGNVVLGHETTVPVAMSDMLHHTAAVSRVLKKPFLIGDMPFGSYHGSVDKAVENAIKLVQIGGAQAVKLEGGDVVADQVRAITAAGIPVMGHLGLTPQSVHQIGGFRVQGRGQDAAERLKNDAKVLADAGCFAIVLELVPSKLALEVTNAISIPTIGIGAGVNCSGQVLVLHDLLGFDDDFKPKFLKKYADLASLVKEALGQFDAEVKAGAYPGPEHTFEQ